LILGVIVPVLTIVPEDASAAPSITITKVKLNNDWTKLKIKADVSGFTVTQLSDLRVSILLFNFDNGEVEFVTVNPETLEVVGSFLSDQTATITKINMKSDWTKIKVKADLSEFTPTQLSDLGVTLTIHNLETNEIFCYGVDGTGEFIPGFCG